MKKFGFLLALALCASFAMPAMAVSLDDLAAAPGLPELPMLEAFTETVNFSGGTCAVIRPVQYHSQCNYFLCESHGCGAPFDFDPVDCACYCGYAF